MDTFRAVLAGVTLLSLVFLCGCAGTRTAAPEDATGDRMVAPLAKLPVITPDPLETLQAGNLTSDTAPPSCIPSWVCTHWSECSPAGLTFRTCSDASACNTSAGRPTLEDQCRYIPVLPAPGPYTIIITGDLVCRQTAESAVTALRIRASPDYEYFRRYVGAINCTYPDMCYRTGFAPGEPRFPTVCIASLENPPTVYVDEPFWRSDPVWLAGVFVHEACHSEGYQEYILKEGASYDLTEFSGWKFERRCCDRMRSTWNQLGAPAYTNDLYRGCSL